MDIIQIKVRDFLQARDEPGLLRFIAALLADRAGTESFYKAELRALRTGQLAQTDVAKARIQADIDALTP